MYAAKLMEIFAPESRVKMRGINSETKWQNREVTAAQPTRLDEIVQKLIINLSRSEGQ